MLKNKNIMAEYRLWCLVLVLVLVLEATGCSSIRYRKNYYAQHPKVYPGVKEDFGGYSGLSSISRAGWPAWAVMLSAAALVIDIPFSFVLDTICLPYDIIKTRAQEEEQGQEEGIIGTK